MRQTGSDRLAEDQRLSESEFDTASFADAQSPSGGVNDVLAGSGELPQLCQPFVGRWNRLVSTTNWEKGRIIGEWRRAMLARGAGAAESSDEAWSQLVGGVSPQHVGRLRRTFERFGETFDQFDGLYWSHFYAALDWEDAEMWLEGAIQNRWSVSAMRRTRWQTMGRVGAEPASGEIVISEPAEEEHVVVSDDRQGPERPRELGVTGPLYEGPDFGERPADVEGHRADHPDGDGDQRGGSGGGAESAEPAEPAEPAVPIFQSMPPLPDDLADALDAMKVAILRHKLDEWREVSAETVLQVLQGLQLLVGESAR